MASIGNSSRLFILILPTWRFQKRRSKYFFALRVFISITSATDKHRVLLFMKRENIIAPNR